MNQYEELIKIIQNQSILHNSESLKIGVMKSKDTCEIGSLILDRDDLYIASHLLERIRIDSEDGYLEPLKAGDLVVLYRLNDEKYLLLERVV